MVDLSVDHPGFRTSTRSFIEVHNGPSVRPEPPAPRAAAAPIAARGAKCKTTSGNI